MQQEQTISNDSNKESTEKQFHPIVKWVASAVSYLFHPLFIPTYVFYS